MMSNIGEKTLKGDDSYNLHLKARHKWDLWVSDHSDWEINFLA